MELKDIQNLIRFVAKSGASEVKLEMEDIKITIKTASDELAHAIYQPVAAPIATPVATPLAAAPVAPVAVQAPVASTEAAPVADDSKYITVTSPMIGTFYRKPSPGKPNFVEVGDVIQSDSVVCVIEAMKLFNEIESEVSGKIVKVLVEDSSPVEFGQPLFLVDPS